MPERRQSPQFWVNNAIERMALCYLMVLTITVCKIVWAQQNQRPGARLPELPEYRLPSSKDSNILPSVQLPEKPGTQSLEAGRRVFVRDYRLIGNTVLSDKELESLLEPYANREVSFAELAKLRDTLTRAYIERGYVTSGAVIPPQTLTDGVLEVRLIEGVLIDVKVETDGRLQESYVRKRMQRGVVDPLDVNVLEERLQILRNHDERIANLDANLMPSKQRGESVLNLSVTEAKPYGIYLELSNYESPSVGAVRGLVQFVHTNISGFGDRFSATYRQSEGLRGIEGSYAVPLNAYDTIVALHGQFIRSDVVEEPFDMLDIESRSETYGITLSHPVHRSASSRLDMSLTAEFRRAKSFLLGLPFSFSEGVEQGESKIAALRFSQDWTQRRRRRAVAARSTVSVGLDVLGATDNRGDTPDGQFVSWLGQVQYAQRIDWLNTQLITRAAVQLSNSPLLGLEQFSLGGYASVRGYRENWLVRDNGAVASVEARVPVLRRGSALNGLEVGPFLDVGRSWSDKNTTGETTLLSVGIGARWAINDNITVEGTWAEALRDAPGDGVHDLQDDGVQFRLSAAF